MKTNQGVKTLIIVLSLIIIGLVTFIAVDKIVLKNTTETKKDGQNLTTSNANSKDEQKIENTIVQQPSNTVNDIAGVYSWSKDKANGTKLNITLVLNSDGSAEYSASSGYEFESTKGKYEYKDGKVLYTREYFNYDNNNAEYTDASSKVETFIVIDKNTLQNEYYEEKTSLTKTEFKTLNNSALGKDDVLYITEAKKNSDNTYTLKGYLYKHDELNHNEAQIEDRWNLTNQCYTITLSGEIKCDMKYDYDSKYNTVSDVFENYTNANPENVSNPFYKHCFKFIFEGNTCISVENVLTGLKDDSETKQTNNSTSTNSNISINEITVTNEDIAAGTTYTTFNFKGATDNGQNLSGNGTIGYSNVIQSLKSIKVTISEKNLEININEITVKNEDVAAGTMYVEFEFKGTSNKSQNLTGNGTIKYSNVTNTISGLEIKLNEKI